MFRALARLAAVGLFVFLLHPSLASAAAVRWNNAAGGNWNLPGNWLPAAVPTASDTAVIDLAGTYTVTLDVSPSIAALRVSGAPSGVQTLTGTTKNITIANASSIGAQGVLLLSGTCNMNGAGVLTNNGKMTVQGTASVSSALTMANGFTNNGAIELTSSGAATTATLTVTAGTLTNSLGATISSLVGSAGARNLNAAISNAGLITVAQNLTTNKASVAHTNSGTIDLTTGNYTVSCAPATFTTTGTINVPSGRTLTLQGAGGVYNYNGGTMGGAGTVSLTSAQLNLNIPLASSATHLDVNSATVAGPSTLTVSAGTTVNFGSSTLSAPTTVEATGTLQMVSSDHTGGTITNSGVVEWTGTSTSTGSISTQPGSVLRVLGTATASAALTVATGFTNSAAIELTSSGAATTANLTVTAGTLTNALTGTISSLVGSAGARSLNAKLDNQGLITIQQSLVLNKAAAAHANHGTITIAATKTLTVTGASLTEFPAAILQGSGTLTLAGATGF